VIGARPASFNIITAMENPALFERWYSGASWDGWKTILRAAYNLPMVDRDREFLRTVADREPPQQRVKELWIAAGRRSGKDSVASLCAAFAAATFNQGHLLRPGERALILCLASDRQQAKICLEYCRSLFTSTPMLRAMIQRETQNGFELTNNCDIEIGTTSHRSVRGRAIALVVLDEVAFYQSESSASPDLEIYRALLPGLASLPGSMLIGISSPYKKSGILYSKFRDHYGQNNDNILFIRSATRTLNPLISQDIVDAALAEDPAAASAEWMGFFRDDVSNWLSTEAIEAAIDPDVIVRPPVGGVKYFGACDPAGGSGQDSFTAAVAHADANGDIVLDCLAEIRPPYSPTAAVEQVVRMFNQYGLHHCVGDRYSALWCVEGFAKRSFRYAHSDRDGSAIYADALPLYTSGRARILDIKRHTRQLAQLERKTSTTGRDRVSHPVGGHDDLATASCLAMVLAAQPAVEAPQPFFGAQSTTCAPSAYGTWAGGSNVDAVRHNSGASGRAYGPEPSELWRWVSDVEHQNEK
jgi:hypothetical protein